MTYRKDVARGRDITARWCVLAEQRLEHLTELFESGRWRRYYSEITFLENIREAKASVEVWRDLTERGASIDHPTVDIPALRRTKPLVFPEILRNRLFSQQNQPAKIPDGRPLSNASVVPEADQVSLAEPSSADVEIHALVPDATAVSIDFTAIQDRYPLLRNTL